MDERPTPIEKAMFIKISMCMLTRPGAFMQDIQSFILERFQNRDRQSEKTEVSGRLQTKSDRTELGCIFSANEEYRGKPLPLQSTVLNKNSAFLCS